MKKTIQKIFIWFFIIGIIGIILYFGFYDLMIIMIKKTNTIIAEYFIVRMTSIFWTPVVFSTFMVVTFAYYYHQFLISPKWYHYCFLGLIWCCVLLSVSRGALGVLLIGFIILSLIHKKKKLSLQMFLVFISIYIILGFYISSPLIFSSWLAKSASDTIELEGGISRVELWIKSFENFKTHPFGYGLGKAGHIAARFFKDNGQAAAIYSTDGWYLKLANETGIWGLFSYLFLTIYLFVMLLKNKLFDNKDNFLILFFVIFLLINIQNIVSNVLDFYLFSFFYWGIVGLASNIIYSKINIAKNGLINYNSKL
ncbi:MAG: O-antigen ligase family protein [Bacteroidales bacterium]